MIDIHKVRLKRSVWGIHKLNWTKTSNVEKLSVTAVHKKRPVKGERDYLVQKPNIIFWKTRGGRGSNLFMIVQNSSGLKIKFNPDVNSISWKDRIFCNFFSSCVFSGFSFLLWLHQNNQNKLDHCNLWMPPDCIHGIWSILVVEDNGFKGYNYYLGALTGSSRVLR